MRTEPALDARALRQVFGLFATGVTVVTARHADAEPVAITANSFTSVSMEPPLVLWCLDNRSRHLPAFAPGRMFAVHVLNDGQAELALRHARSGGAPESPRAACPTLPVVEGALARIECRVADRPVAGDHHIIIGRVHDVAVADGAPLVFHASRFGRFAPA
ncbi:flavin reductase family protein [Sphingopyxis granuli]|uniref:flavin reductase family protein n=1 Tax=Sphingopyxis granuli TaxID=267128 RepID=UPI001F53CF16|nr:flavin reductase family protein [Sphingopyxis granuli]UNK78704.1 flavin reductase family protein [Sphingopyxis granuli]